MKETTEKTKIEMNDKVKVKGENQELKKMNERHETKIHEEQNKEKRGKKDRLAEAVEKNEKKLEQLQLKYAQAEDRQQKYLLKKEIRQVKRENEEILSIPFYERETNNLFVRAVSAVIRKVMYVMSPSYRAAVQYGIHNAYKDAFMEEKRKEDIKRQPDVKEEAAKKDKEQNKEQPVKDKKKDTPIRNTPIQDNKQSKEMPTPAKEQKLPANISKIQEERALDDCGESYKDLSTASKDHVDTELLADWYDGMIPNDEINSMTSFSVEAVQGFLEYAALKAAKESGIEGSIPVINKHSQEAASINALKYVHDHAPQLFMHENIQKCIGTLILHEPVILDKIIKATEYPSKENFMNIVQGAKEEMNKEFVKNPTREFVEEKANSLKDKTIKYVKSMEAVPDLQAASLKNMNLLIKSISLKDGEIICDDKAFNEAKERIITGFMKEKEAVKEQAPVQTPDKFTVPEESPMPDIIEPPAHPLENLDEAIYEAAHQEEETTIDPVSKNVEKGSERD